MPLTPKFNISQNDEFVIIEINVPWVRVGDMEFVIEDRDFSFYCNPYLLKLQFPYPCIDDERAKAVYDVDKDNGTVYVHVPKMEKGQVFPDLDLLSTLLMKPEPLPTMNSINIEHNGPLIQEMDADEPKKEEVAETSKEHTSKDLLSLEEESEIHSYRKYGFNDLFQNVFKSFEDCSDIIENPIPDDTTVDPLEMMKDMEESKFDADHYLSDYVYGKEDYLYTEFITQWVLADRIIRKRLKGMEEKPLVPESTFHCVQEKKKESVNPLIIKEEKKENIKDGTIKEQPKHKLIEVIEVSTAEKEEEKEVHEKLTGESNYASLIITTEKKEEVKKEEEKEEKEEEKKSNQNEQTKTNTASQDVPVITKKSENITENMKNHIATTRISHEESSDDCKLTSDEKDLLVSIKSIALTIPETKFNQVLFSLVDILCAYCYDVRITQHDPSPESAWTIAILSPTLSWLTPSKSLNSVLLHYVRRVLIYPYLRRYDLARLCIKDCALILKLGKRRILKCLLDIKKIFKYSERKYILNTLYIDKYILWIQTIDYPILYDVAEEINYALKTAVTREAIDLGIPELDEQGKAYYLESQKANEED